MSKNITNFAIADSDYNKIKSLLNICNNSNIELECIFNKKIEINTFRKLISRLKGMNNIFYNEEKFNMLDIQFIDEDNKHDGRSPISYIRRTIFGIDNIINYCTNNICENYTDVYKDKKLDSLKIHDYELKFNVKYEIDIDSDYSDMVEDADTLLKIKTNIEEYKKIPQSEVNNTQKKFRKKERHSFYTNCNNFKIDLTIIKCSKTPNYKLVGSGIFDKLEDYEIEIEFLNENIVSEYLQEEGELTFSEFLELNHKDIVDKFLTYIGYVLQVINNSNYIISTSEKNIIRTNYCNYVKNTFKIKENFISPNPVSLSQSNLVKGSSINILKNYSVTDKADGESRLLFIPNLISPSEKKYNNRVYLINNIIDIVYTGIEITNDSGDMGLTILNSEYIQKDFNGKNIYDIYCYDAYVINDIDLTSLNLFSKVSNNNRLYKLKEFINTYFKDTNSVVNVNYKEFYYSDNIMNDNKLLWNVAIENGKHQNLEIPIIENYKLDGLVFTPNEPIKKFLGKKWINNLKWKPAEENTIDFLVEIVDSYNYKYKIVHLYCGKNINIDGRFRYIKTKFNGSGNSTDISAYICFLEKDRHNNILSKDGLPIYTDTIVEFRYNVNSTKDDNYKWIPVRTRYDKTRKYQEKRGNMYGNDIITARNIWNSIHNPITFKMISNGENIDKYYTNQSSDSKNISIMRNYHNFIKRSMIERVSSDISKTNLKLSVLDIGCGRGGDIHKYYDNKNITNLTGLDKSNDCIKISKERFSKKQNQNLKAEFYQADCKFLLDDVSAYDNKSDFVKMNKLLNKENFDIISMQFCIHYFFDSEQSLDNIIENIDKNLKNKGYFIGTSMNRERVINILNGKNIKEATQGNQVLWRIAKENNQLDTYGTKINVFIESIGNARDEWLVNFNELTMKLREKNINLVPNDGLVKFDDKLLSSFKINNGGWDVYMTNAEKEFSELNQYFIFQKNGIKAEIDTSILGGGCNQLFKNEIDNILTMDEQKLLLYHCTSCTNLEKYINEKIKSGFNVMVNKKPCLKNVKELNIIECGKTCGLKKTALNTFCEKLGIDLFTTLPNGKVKKKKKDDLNTAIINYFKAHNLFNLLKT